MIGSEPAIAHLAKPEIGTPVDYVKCERLIGLGIGPCPPLPRKAVDRRWRVVALIVTGGCYCRLYGFD